MTGALLAIVAALATFGVAKLVLQRLARRSLRRRLVPEAAGTAGRRANVGARTLALCLERLRVAADTRLDGARIWFALQRLLERAGLARTPGELLVWVGGAGLGLGALFALAAQSLLPLIAVPALAAAAAYGYLRVRAYRRLVAFDEQLPSLLTELSASLRAGHSFTQALQALAADSAEPARPEFERVLAETRLGRSLEDALADLAVRLPSQELRFVTSAIALQRQVGGSLASLFDTVVETVRERHRFRRKVRSLTASNRLSAVILIVLPFALAGIISAMNPTYMEPLFGSSAGRLLIVGALLLMAVGTYALRRTLAIKGTQP